MKRFRGIMKETQWNRGNITSNVSGLMGGYDTNMNLGLTDKHGGAIPCIGGVL